MGRGASFVKVAPRWRQSLSLGPLYLTPPPGRSIGSNCKDYILVNNTFCSQCNTSYTFSIYISMHSNTNNSCCSYCNIHKILLHLLQRLGRPRTLFSNIPHTSSVNYKIRIHIFLALIIKVYYKLIKFKNYVNFTSLFQSKWDVLPQMFISMS